MAGVAGFGPTDARVKVWCLTTWLHPNSRLDNYIIKKAKVNPFFKNEKILERFPRKKIDKPILEDYNDRENIWEGKDYSSTTHHLNPDGF